MAYLIGRTLLNRYRIDGFLGRGGMAGVYRAWDAKRSVWVALKMLNEDLAEDYVFLRRFAREAQALEQLQHPHIVRFFGFEESQGQAFLVMEYVDGSTLRRQLGLIGRPLTLSEALAVLQPVCSALHYAHGMGVYHCDVKPANIFIERGGRVVLGDFGIARLSESATVTFSTPGTPAYMTPEQCQGEAVDARTDVYSLGITAYEMMTLDRPFKGDTEGTTGSRGERVRWEQINAPPPRPRSVNGGISPEAEATILRALEKEPQRRQQGALEFYRELSVAGAVEAASSTFWGRDAEGLPPELLQPPSPPPSAPRKEQARTGKRLSAQGTAVILIGIIAVLSLVGFLALKPGSLEHKGVVDISVPASVPASPPTHTPTRTPTPTPTVIPMPTETPSPLLAETPSLAEREATLLESLSYRDGVGDVVFAYQVERPPQIDGWLDEWAEYVHEVPYEVHDPEGNRSGRSDLYGRFQVGWDADNLYLAVEVADDVHVQTESGMLLYRGDDVEIQIDTDLLGDFYETHWSSDDRQVGFSAGDFRSREPEAYIWLPADEGWPGTMITVAAQETGDGYTLEAGIPWSALGAQPSIEVPIGFCLSLSDNDVRGTSQQQSLVSYVPTRKWGDPTTWGTLILVDWR